MVGTDPNRYDSEHHLHTSMLSTHVPIIITFVHAPYNGSELDRFPCKCKHFLIRSRVYATMIVLKGVINRVLKNI